MRVTQTMLDRNLVFWMGRHMDRLIGVNRQLSTGRRVNTISDDVLAGARILELDRENEQLDGYLRNGESVNTVLSFATSSLEKASEAIARIKELSIQAATGTYNDSNRQSMATGVDNLLGTLIALANVQHEGFYVFSGEAIHTAPFLVTTDVNGQVQAVTYQGQEISTLVEVGPTTQAEANLVGRQVFQDQGDLFATAIELRNAIAAGDQPEIERLIGELETSHTDIRQSLGRLGERQSQLHMMRTAWEGIRERNNQVGSDLGDADMSEVGVQYNTLMAHLQIIMKMAAEASMPSILHFL